VSEGFYVITKPFRMVVLIIKEIACSSPSYLMCNPLCFAGTLVAFFPYSFFFGGAGGGGGGGGYFFFIY